MKLGVQASQRNGNGEGRIEPVRMGGAESKSCRGYGEGNFYAEEQGAHAARELEGNW